MNDSIYWIALERAKGIGPANLKMIYDTLAGPGLSITDLFSLTKEEITAEFSFHEKIADAIIEAKDLVFEIEKIYHELIDHHIETILFCESSYPEHLHKTLGTAIPPVLYTFGNKNILKMKGVAVLTENESSEKGEKIAFLAAKELSIHKIATISGLTNELNFTQKGALTHNGNIIAILPYGILNFKFADFFKNVNSYDNLLIISAFYPKTEFNKFNIFIRNRIACALSHAVYIVESSGEGEIAEAVKSAEKLKLPLFTTEYKDYPPSAQFNKKLIEDGAKPVKGRMVNDELTPNLDELIGLVKFK
ncbi:MAG: DNA-processing protein DprA [Spirochaetes bacterium]|nr:DNA-processing protein DprA [Spirochaetota bacterium]